MQLAYQEQQAALHTCKQPMVVMLQKLLQLEPWAESTFAQSADTLLLYYACNIDYLYAHPYYPCMLLAHDTLPWLLTHWHNAGSA